VLEIWKLLDEFKKYCKRRDWKFHEKDDIIEAENEYHRFIWCSHLYPNTFRRVVTHQSYLIREGVHGRMIRVSYVAWLLLKDPSISMMRMISEMPGLIKRVAIYNVSSALRGKRECQRLNETNSIVFAEFDEFLKTRYGMKLKSIKKVKNLSSKQP